MQEFNEQPTDENASTKPRWNNRLILGYGAAVILLIALIALAR